ncbi:MAG TPA: hypothetical protein VNZ58_12295 [Thermomicrobiales bacterium]|nr:hypothetical protein [Thermomicrobiales bacterium]
MTRTFHHIGLPATEPQPGETWVESGKLWISNPAHHPQRVEWLRHAPDSPIPQEMRVNPHVAYTVDDLDAEVAGKTIISAPAEIGEPPFARAAFIDEDGLTVELMQIYPGRQWFDDDLS